MSGIASESVASADAVRVLFRERFGREPDVVASAPGRVNLIGEHTDYNGGEVLPIAIARRTWVAAGVRRTAGDATLRAASTGERETGEVSLAQPARSGRWWDYLTGVTAPLLVDHPGTGVDLAVTSDVPSGAGLSSSAALEVAGALAVSAALGSPISCREAAMTAWRAESQFVGVACGIMDQFASALGSEGQALHIDCETTATSLVPFGDAVLIVDSGVRRSLRESAFNQRRAECVEALRLLQVRWPGLRSLAEAEPAQVEEASLPDPLGRRAMHVSRETRRVRDAVALLRASHPLTSDLLVGSHESLRDLYECSRPELDWLVAHAASLDGVRGARLTGAGWGGCVIVIGDESALAAAAPRLGQEYQARFGIEPRLWLTRAARGAGVDSRPE